MSAELHNHEEQHLKQLEMSWDEAVSRRDADSLAHLVTDDYEVTDMNGHIHNKSTVLRAVASDPQVKPYRRDDVKVQIDGNTAVVTGRITWPRRNGNGDGNGNGNGHAYVRAHYLKVYIKNPDGWKAKAARATRIANGEG